MKKIPKTLALSLTKAELRDLAVAVRLRAEACTDGAIYDEAEEKAARKWVRLLKKIEGLAAWKGK